MKIKEGYIVREVAGQIVVLPTGDDLDLNMMITLNGTGRFLWHLLEKETDMRQLIDAVLSEYDVDEDTAKNAVSSFVDKLHEHGFIA